MLKNFLSSADLEEELERQRKFARMRAARLAALEEEEQRARRRVQVTVEDDTPPYMKPFKRGGTTYNRPPRPRWVYLIETNQLVY